MALRQIFTTINDAWNAKSSPSMLGLISLISGAFITASGLRWVISNIRTDAPFALYLPVVMLATSLGGIGPGIVTLLAGAVLGIALSPSTAPDSSALLGLLVIYIGVSGLTIWFAHHYRSLVVQQRLLVNQLRAEESHRVLLMREMSHRLKNKIATIQAVAHQVLRDHPAARDALSQRLTALAATDDLIARSSEEGCDLRELFRVELAPYESPRLTFLGPDTHLGPKLAVSLGLIIHELATNSAKYGALSVGSGLVQISWRLLGDRLRIAWDEGNGPRVAPPAREGFGTRLMNSALAAHDGTVTMDYLTTGLHCQINCRMEDARRRHVSQLYDQ
jgi:two-component sensor histidine kinase